MESADEKDGYFNIPLAVRARWLDLLRSHGVRYTFAGHYHRNVYAASEGFQMITTGPVGKPLGPDPSGIRIAIVRPDSIQHEYFGFGNLPNKLDTAITLPQGR